MNRPRHAPSIMYSGQCRQNAGLALSDQRPALAPTAAGSDSSCAANVCTAAAGVHWISDFMPGGIRPAAESYEFGQEIVVACESYLGLRLVYRKERRLFSLSRWRKKLVQSRYSFPG
jgi:hypothetical protein